MKPELLKLIRWRSKTLKNPSAERLVQALSVEGLRYTDIPPDLYQAVVAFRHLRQDARLRLVARAGPPGRWPGRS